MKTSESEKEMPKLELSTKYTDDHTCEHYFIFRKKK